jgi:hypothetical protein
VVENVSKTVTSSSIYKGFTSIFNSGESDVDSTFDDDSTKSDVKITTKTDVKNTTKSNQESYIDSHKSEFLSFRSIAHMDKNATLKMHGNGYYQCYC